MNIVLQGTEIALLPEKAMWIPSLQVLLIADLHYGKLNHFRRSGIAVPTEAGRRGIENLIGLLNKVNPSRTIFLGDLFHSHYNEAWEEVGQVVRHFPACTFELVEGNHDIMSSLQYERYGLTVYERIILPPFILTHEPLEPNETLHYNLAGHIHPGLKLAGKARQAMTLPCFWFGENQGLLPAFGVFTGLGRIKRVRGDRAYVVADGKVFPVS